MNTAEKATKNLASGVIKQLEDKLSRALDEALPGWTMDDLQKRCHAVTYGTGANAQTTYYFDDEPILVAGKVTFHTEPDVWNAPDGLLEAVDRINQRLETNIAIIEQSLKGNANDQ